MERGGYQLFRKVTISTRAKKQDTVIDRTANVSVKCHNDGTTCINVMAMPEMETLYSIKTDDPICYYEFDDKEQRKKEFHLLVCHNAFENKHYVPIRLAPFVKDIK